VTKSTKKKAKATGFNTKNRIGKNVGWNMNGTYTSSQPKNGSGIIKQSLFKERSTNSYTYWSFLNLSFAWFIVAFVLLWSRHASVIGIILTSIVFVESKLKVSYSKNKKVLGRNCKRHK